MLTFKTNLFWLYILKLFLLDKVFSLLIKIESEIINWICSPNIQEIENFYQFILVHQNVWILLYYKEIDDNYNCVNSQIYSKMFFYSWYQQCLII